jgi:hypothetical protein
MENMKKCQLGKINLPPQQEARDDERDEEGKKKRTEIGGSAGI